MPGVIVKTKTLCDKFALDTLERSKRLKGCDIAINAFQYDKFNYLACNIDYILPRGISVKYMLKIIRILAIIQCVGFLVIFQGFTWYALFGPMIWFFSHVFHSDFFVYRMLKSGIKKQNKANTAQIVDTSDIVKLVINAYGTNRNPTMARETKVDGE